MPPSTTTALDGAKERPWYGWLGLGLLCGLLGYGTYLMWLITAQYWPIRLDAAFLNLKQDALAHPYYAYAFFGHVFSSFVVLLAGLTQFSSRWRAAFPSGHRRLGQLYIGLILGLAAPTGLVMAWHANGGWTAQVSFLLQAILWWVWTYWAYRAARQQQWAAHRHYMLLSYALTLSALSLRFWKWGIVLLWAPPPMDTYRVVAWLGWVGNVVLVYGYVGWRQRKEEGEAIF